MNRFKPGDRVYIPTYENLKMLGWQDKKSVALRYDYGVFHDDFEPRSFIIHRLMYHEYGGKWVTVDSPLTGYSGSYRIKEDNGEWRWPLDLLNKQISHFTISCLHEEGMTAIDGWIICKHCGDNLRELK